MRSVLLKVALLVPGVAATALLHHGHILAFVGRVHETLAARLGRGYNVRSQASRLQVMSASATLLYELAVRRKTRSIEIGLRFEGERDEASRYAQALANRAAEIQAQLGNHVQLEEETRKRFRLYATLPIAGDAWRPKEQLTDALAAEAAERLARFVEVLEPIVERERAAGR